MIGMTVCSGIGAPELSAPWIDWRYQSEIDKFPSAVLAHRFPKAVNLGDMTKFKEWPDADINVLCGGTPCQSFSVAGLRGGLADPRGNLMLTYLAIAERYRPRWIVWENVPGVLSSDAGRDFGTFLGAVGKLGYGFAYRVLDAQHCRTRNFPLAVPQRRRRVFVVGYLGDWRRAAAVLFDGESLSGHPPPRREAGQAVAGTLSARTTGGGGLGTDFELSGGLVVPPVFNALCARDYKGARPEADQGMPLVAHALRGEGFDASEDGTGRGTPLVPVAIQERAVSENPDAGPDGAGFRVDGAAYTLEARTTPQAVAYRTAGDGAVYEEGQAVAPLTTGTDPNAHVIAQPYTITERGRKDGPSLEYRQDGTANTIMTPNGGRSGMGVGAVVTPPAIAYGIRHDATRVGEAKTPSADANGNVRLRPPGLGVSEGVAPTIDASQPHFVAFAQNTRDEVRLLGGDGQIAGALAAEPGMKQQTYICQDWAVRRLTPTECERLMGFPGGFTAIPWRGKPADQCPDGPRYKALGNSWAVNCGEWIFDRIKMVDEMDAK